MEAGYNHQQRDLPAFLQGWQSRSGKDVSKASARRGEMNTFAFEHTGEIDPVRYTRGKPTELKLAGRQSQFQALLAPMHQRLYRFVRHSLHNAQDAEDVTQEALLRAWAHFETFDAQRSFDAWVFRIAGNLIVDHQRRKRRRSELPLDAPILHEDGGESAYHSIFSDSTGDPEA